MAEENSKQDSTGSKTPETEKQNAATPAKKKRNGWMVGGIVVAVIVVVAIAFGVWHNQPSFCNSVCHTPMDPYVQTYDSDNPAMMSSLHRTEANMSCLDCHEARLGQQISEVGTWMDDATPVDANGMLVNHDTSVQASPENCLKSGCHDWNEVVDSTWGFEGNDEEFNPHSSHQNGSIQCSDCHKSHTNSVLYCAKCHDLNVPEGWEVPTDE